MSTYRNHSLSPDYGPIDPLPSMSDEEQAAVRARRARLDRTASYLGDRNPAEVLGEPGATLDQIQVMIWEPDTCGCKIVLAHAEGIEPRALSIVRNCPAHAGIAAPAELQGVLMTENRAKNALVAAEAVRLGVPPAEVQWHMDAQRRPVSRG